MRQLSSRETKFWKGWFPWYVYGFVAVMAFIAAVFMVHMESFELGVILAPIGLVIIIDVTGKIFAYDVVDAVYDDRDFLVVKNGELEGRIALSDVAGIKHSYYMHGLPRLSLFLREEAKFGEKVSFMLPYKFVFDGHPLVRELRERVESSRVSS